MSDDARVAAPAPAEPDVSAARPAGPAGAAAPQPPPSSEVQVADRLVSMADHCLHNHLLRQAAEIYFMVLDRPGASASDREHARRRLLEVAEVYERTGNPHQARGIYEHLL